MIQVHADVAEVTSPHQPIHLRVQHETMQFSARFNGFSISFHHQVDRREDGPLAAAFIAVGDARYTTFSGELDVADGRVFFNTETHRRTLALRTAGLITGRLAPAEHTDIVAKLLEEAFTAWLLSGEGRLVVVSSEQAKKLARLRQIEQTIARLEREMAELAPQIAEGEALVAAARGPAAASPPDPSGPSALDALIAESSE